MPKEAVAFKWPVYKDQGTPANEGKIIQIGDTVRFVISNDMGAETTVDVVVTGVGNGGHDIQWDASTNTNLITEKVVRVHRRHEYNCPGRRNFTATLTELSPASVKMLVSTITLNGGVFAVGIEEAAAANGIEPTFVAALLAKINSILGREGVMTGVVTGTAGSQVLTLTLSSFTGKWSAIAGAGATIVQPTVVP